MPDASYNTVLIPTTFTQKQEQNPTSQLKWQPRPEHSKLCQIKRISLLLIDTYIDKVCKPLDIQPHHAKLFLKPSDPRFAPDLLLSIMLRRYKTLCSFSDALENRLV
jgi:hypothetical protein